MREPTAPEISKAPFFLGDALLLGLAGFIYSQSKSPMNHWEMFACILCIALGAGLSVVPFVLEYRARIKFTEAGSLVTVVSQMEHLEELAAQIGYATSQWQVVRESAGKTANSAREIAQGMAAEVKGFNEFIQRSNEGEKATLRFEVEKLRRAESEWLKVLVVMLDHVYALHQAAVRSRQSGVVDQIGKLQNACHEVVRRVGLTPFVAAPADAFDAQRHQLVEGEPKPADAAAVEETVVSGYTFQGKILRPALVKLRKQNGSVPAHTQTAEANA